MQLNSDRSRTLLSVFIQSAQSSRWFSLFWWSQLSQRLYRSFRFYRWLSRWLWHIFQWISVLMISTSANAYVSDPLLYQWRAKVNYEWDYLVHGLAGSYVSAFPYMGVFWMYSTDLRGSGGSVMTDCPGVKCPGLILYSGPSWLDSSKSIEVVLPNSAINDVFLKGTTTLAPNRMFSRATVIKIQKTDDPNRAGGDFWAMLYVTNGYPPADGRVYPAIARSKDGRQWTYLGQIKGEPWTMYPDQSRTWGSGRSLEVRPGVIPLNHAVPAANKFYSIVDAMGGVKLAGIYSADGITWYFVKNADGSIKELTPTELIAAGKPGVFPSLRRVGSAGYLMALSEGWYTTGAAVRNVNFLHSCDGVIWQVLGDPTKWHPLWLGGKNANLTYFDKSTRTLHIMITAMNFNPDFQQFHNTAIVPATIACPIGTKVVP